MKRKKRETPQTKEEKERDVLLRNIEEENEMIDDHGPVIIGSRGSKPVLPRDKEKEAD